MHALFEDIHVDFKFSTMEQSGSFAIYSMQIDNQLLTSSHPVVLSHDAPPPQARPSLRLAAVKSPACAFPACNSVTTACRN